jgi:DNA mismatch repair protein MutL
VTSSSKTIAQFFHHKQKQQNQATSTPTPVPVKATSSQKQKKAPPISSKADPPPSTKKKPKVSKTKSVLLNTIMPGIVSKPKFSSRDDWIHTKTFPKMRLISQSGQLNKVYFVFEGEEGYYILDMHAADERINYEKELAAFKKGGLVKQQLLVPFTIQVPINLKDFILETLQDFAKFGFEVDHLGGPTFTLRAIPAILKSVTDTKILTDICLEIMQIGKESSYTQSVETIIKYIACHESIRGGDEITAPEQPIQLLKALSTCENPHHCAHGRPTMLFFSWYYLEKEFHR